MARDVELLYPNQTASAQLGTAKVTGDHSNYIAAPSVLKLQNGDASGPRRLAVIAFLLNLIVLPSM